MKKLLIVGSDKVYSIENYYSEHLKALGIEVFVFNAQSRFYDYYQAGLLHKLLYRAGLSGIERKINIEFLEALEAFGPQAVWVFKGMEITPNSLERIRSMNIPLVNYNPDNPFLFTGRGSGNSNVTRSIGLYDLHFTYNFSIQARLEQQYSAKVEYLPFGFEDDIALYARARAQPEVIKCCFVGNPDRQRVSFLRRLLDQGMRIDIYGNDWARYIDHPNATLLPPVYKEELVFTLVRYRVQLNMLRIHNPDSHNMRSFEVPGYGGIMLAPFTEEHKTFFEDGSEVFLYRDAEDCVRLAEQILGMEAAAASRIRDAARQRSVGDGYSYAERSAFVLKTLENYYG